MSGYYVNGNKEWERDYNGLSKQIFMNNQNVSQIFFRLHRENQNDIARIPNEMFRGCPLLSQAKIEIVSSTPDGSGYAKSIAPLYITKDAFTGATRLKYFDCTRYDVSNFGNNPNATKILGEPIDTTGWGEQQSGPNVPSPQRVVITIPDTLSSEVSGNRFRGKVWKTIRLRDASQFIKSTYIISADDTLSEPESDPK